MKRLARASWILGFAAVLEVCWWLITGKLSEPLRNMISKWLLITLAVGTWAALDEWKANQQKFNESSDDEDR